MSTSEVDGGLPTFSGSKTRHGTTSGWTLHKARREDPCVPCINAKSKYDHQRHSTSWGKDETRSRGKARRRAFNLLAQRHQAEFDELYRDALIRIYRDEDF